MPTHQYSGLYYSKTEGMAQRKYKRSEIIVPLETYQVRHNLQQSTCIGAISISYRIITVPMLESSWDLLSNARCYVTRYYYKRYGLTSTRFQINPGSSNGRQRRVRRLNPIKRPTKRSMDRARGDECCGLGTNFSLFCRIPAHTTPTHHTPYAHRRK